MQVALVTGANRGLGAEVTLQLGQQGYRVIVGCRDEAKAKEKTAELKKAGIDAIALKLDVGNEEDIIKAFEFVKKEQGRLDVLVNNAGILLDRLPKSQGPFTIEKGVLQKTLDVNVIGPYLLCDLFIPMMREQKYGRIVNISSELGQLASMESGDESYRISKTAINAVTCIFASQGKGFNVLVNSVDPGWVKTDMGGPHAPRTLEKGVETIVWAATLPNDGPTGHFLRDKNSLAW